MANVFAPFGFRPVRRLDGAPWNDAIVTRQIAAANSHGFFQGDVVTVLNTGYIDTLTQAGANNQTLGIFLGCEQVATSSGSPWSNTKPAATTANDVTAYICLDPMVVFRVQVGTGASPGAVGGPAALADIGQNFNFRNGAGSTLSGISGGYIDYATAQTTNTLPFQMLGFVQDPPGVNGNDPLTAGNVIEVKLNSTIINVGSTGI